GALPGGNAVSFDWRWLAGRRWRLPWMLSGGLHAGNVGEAVRLSRAGTVDGSSGVEDGPGRKNPAKGNGVLEGGAAPQNRRRDAAKASLCRGDAPPCLLDLLAQRLGEQIGHQPVAARRQVPVAPDGVAAGVERVLPSERCEIDDLDAAGKLRRDLCPQRGI